MIIPNKPDCVTDNLIAPTIKLTSGLQTKKNSLDHVCSTASGKN